VTCEKPSGWGADSLSQFLQVADDNALATFANMRPFFDRLARIDALYRRLICDLNNNPQWFAGFFFLRAHGAYLGACRLSVSGQLAESFMALRGCLESSLYGLHVSKDPTRAEIWLRRHESDESITAVQGEFSIRNVMRTLESASPELRIEAKRLYDIAIDYGGHPNERAFTSSTLTRSTESGTELVMAYLNVVPPALLFVLGEVARIGICALEVFGLVLPDSFTTRCSSDVEILKTQLYSKENG